MASNVEFYSWIGVLLVVYTLGLETAFFRFMARSKDQPIAEKNRIFQSVTQHCYPYQCIYPQFCCLVWLPKLRNWLNYPGQERFVQWSALLVAIDAIVAIPFARLRVENRAREFVGRKITNILIVVALNIFFLSYWRKIFMKEST